MPGNYQALISYLLYFITKHSGTLIVHVSLNGQVEHDFITFILKNIVFCHLVRTEKYIELVAGILSLKCLHLYFSQWKEKPDI